MKTILVDDERWGLKRFELECADVDGIELVGTFESAGGAVSFAEDHRVDLAFLDIEMPEMSGLELSEKLRELYPDIVIIFVSAYDRYMQQAFREHGADYFVVKPYSAEEVQSVLERARLLSARQRKRVAIHTFGRFEIYVDGAPVRFTSPKAKELLAILVDKNGEAVTAEDAFSLMWSEKCYNHTDGAAYRRALLKLQKTLSEAGIENILAYTPHARAIRCDMVECDYFALLREDKKAVRDYQGRYMSDYSWSEDRIYLLNYIKLKGEPAAEDILYPE